MTLTPFSPIYYDSIMWTWKTESFVHQGRLCFWGFLYFTNPCHENLHHHHINPLIHLSIKALFLMKPFFKKKAFKLWQTQNSHWRALYRKIFFCIPNNSCKAPPTIKACSSNKESVFSTRHRNKHLKVTKVSLRAKEYSTQCLNSNTNTCSSSTYWAYNSKKIYIQLL